MFDKHVYHGRPVTLGEDLRKGGLIAFLLSVVAPAMFGVGSAVAEGNKRNVAAELREAKQNSFKFVKIAGMIAAGAVTLIIIGFLVRFGLFAWFISMVMSNSPR